MNKEHPTFSELIQHFEGSMNKEVQLHVDNCDRCQTTLEGIRYAKEHGGIDNLIASSQPKIYKHIKSGQKHFIWIRYAAAVVLLISAMGYWFLSQFGSNDYLAQELNNPYPLAMIVRGDTDLSLKKFEDAYRSGDYRQAETTLKELGDENDDVRFYLALSQFYQYPTGITHATEGFTELSMAEGRFQEQSRWFLGLCYLGVGEEEKAKSIFEEIANTESHYKQQLARNILKTF